MYLRKKKLKPMAMASIESVRKVVRFCDVRRSGLAGERNVPTYLRSTWWVHWRTLGIFLF